MPLTPAMCHVSVYYVSMRHACHVPRLPGHCAKCLALTVRS